MFVQKLSLFGFKSFNRKVSLDFDAGISGVIGPNGCGKSNIVDALRWVLGEQSTKQLRGAKMEDVIFNGSRDEKPLSLAEVELTLNNERGRLPIEFDTVAVSRRLYRSGVSEYFINKKLVRLRDVRELFMDTGMGSHAYSVIERQMVDNILSDNTGHRRFLFEEAAGIMKYKTRKREAINKLDATQRDLLRVNDIISEVERQVNSLRRQVGRAERYQEFTTEARELDLSLSRIQRAVWSERLGALESDYRQALESAQTGETEVAALEAQLQQLHLTVLEEEKRLAEAREELATVDDEVGQVNSRILVLRERLEATHRRIHEADDHKVRLDDRRSRNTAGAGEVEERRRALADREAGERGALEARETELAEADRVFRALRETVTAHRTEASALRDATIRAEKEVEAEERGLEELGPRRRAESERRTTVAARAGELEGALAAGRDKLDTARARVTEFESDREVLAARRENAQSRLDLMRKQLSEKREAEAAARSRLTTLEDLQARYEGFAPGVRALLAGDTRDASVQGTVGDLLRIPARWVAALEPALAALWQVVVVEDTAAARRLVDRLGADELGYASLLPLDRVPETQPGAADITWAADVVETGSAYAGLCRYLLGEVALVETVDEALSLVQAGRARRAVTPGGVVVDEAVFSGGTGGPEGTDLVEREEALQRCRKDLAALADGLSELTGNEAELKEEIVDLERKLAALETELSAARDARGTAEKDEAGLVQEQRHVADQIEQIDARERALAEEAERREASLTALRARLEELAGKSTRAAESHAGESERLNEAETRREAIMADVHELRVAWSKLEAELADTHGAAERLQRERGELEEEWERTVSDQETAREQVGEIETELEQRASQVQGLHEQRDGKAEIVAARERDRGEAQARERQDAEALREKRRLAGTSRESAHGAELQLQELRSELRHLDERLREEYELDPNTLGSMELSEPPEGAAERLAELREKIKRMGPVNLLAMEEFEEKSERLDFMTTQRDDLVRAKTSLEKTIEQINRTASGMFLETFAAVQENFQKTFKVLFQGGECSLTLTGDDALESDIDVVARPRGKRPQGIQQLSSGERALTAIALLFAIYLVKPSPFCILDEVDAPLDDANIDRFVAMVQEFSKKTQFIVITHNKKTMEAADCLYGITMQKPGVSSVVSVKLDGARAKDVATRQKGVEFLDTDEAGNGHGADGEETPLSPESVIAQ